MAQRTKKELKRLKRLHKSKFCSHPYREVHMDSQGVFGPCCQFVQRFVDVKKYPKLAMKHRYNMAGLDTIKQYLESAQLQRLKDDLSKGVEPESCKYCWKNEKIGSPSMRTRNIEKDISAVKEVFITFGNQCNTACRICNSSRSSLIQKYDKLYSDKIKDPYLKEFIQKDHAWDKGKTWYTDIAKNILDIVEDLEVIKITGGEPFINVHFDRFIDTLIASDKQLPDIMITTNGSFKLDQIKKLKKFKSVQLLISCDALGKEHYEHLRWPLKWDNFIDSIDSVFDLDFEVGVDFQIVIHNLNLQHIPDAIKYFNNNFIGKNARCSFTTLNGADWYTVANTPEKLRKETCEKIAKMQIDSRIKPDANQMISYIKNSKRQRLSSLISHVKHTDQYRDVDTWKFLGWSPEQIS